jgi:hypothetical protein
LLHLHNSQYVSTAGMSPVPGIAVSGYGYRRSGCVFVLLRQLQLESSVCQVAIILST